MTDLLATGWQRSTGPSNYASIWQRGLPHGPHDAE